MLAPGRGMLVVSARFHSGFANLSVSLWVLVNLPRWAGLIGPELCRFPRITLLGSSVNRDTPPPPLRWAVARPQPHRRRGLPPSNAHMKGLCSRIHPQTRYPPPISQSPASTNNPPMMSNRSTSYLPASLDLLWAGVYSPAPRRQEGGSCQQRTRPWCV